MKTDYIVLTEDFCKLNNGTSEGIHIFSFARTNTGLVVTPMQVMFDMPNLFKDFVPTYVVELSIEDFYPDYTPPESYGFGVIIPTEYLLPFKDDKFILGGFEIPLIVKNNERIVDLAYFLWPKFRAELDSGNHEDLKRALMEVWDYVSKQASEGKVVQL